LTEEERDLSGKFRVDKLLKRRLKKREKREREI